MNRKTGVAGKGNPTNLDDEMIPPTKNGLPATGCLSAMQKCIRRNLELDAMRFAVELHQTSKGFASMVTNRLEIISHEDVDSIAAPWIVSYVRTAREQERAWYDPEKMGKSLGDRQLRATSRARSKVS